jgi:membrane protein YqaA with SNARE-associated domain
VPAFFRVFLTWWGAFLVGALDSSLVFFMPFGIDALVIYLSARDENLFWLYPLLATAGSVAGAAVTYWIGHKIGDAGLERMVEPHRLERLRARVRNKGAVAMAIPALMPPPFPLTIFTLTCGALAVNRWLFLAVFGAMRLLRFSVEATLARVYGRGIVRVLESEGFQFVIIGFIVITIIGTAVSAVMLWRKTHRPAMA